MRWMPLFGPRSKESLQRPRNPLGDTTSEIRLWILSRDPESFTKYSPGHELWCDPDASKTNYVCIANKASLARNLYSLKSTLVAHYVARSFKNIPFEESNVASITNSHIGAATQFGTASPDPDGQEVF